MQKFDFIAAIVAGTLLAAIPAAAEDVDIASVADLASRKAAEGDLKQSRQYLGLAMRRLWAASPLALDALVLIDEEANGYKDFVARPDNMVKAGETVRIYAEPIGYHFSKQDNMYAIGLSTDIKIKSDEGLVLAEANDFAQVEFTKRYRAMDIMMQLAFVVPDLKPADYVIEFTVNDQHSDKSVTHSLPIAVVE